MTRSRSGTNHRSKFRSGTFGSLGKRDKILFQLGQQSIEEIRDTPPPHLDLHGMYCSEAKEAIVEALRTIWTDGERVLLINHGKGKRVLQDLVHSKGRSLCRKALGKDSVVRHSELMGPGWAEIEILGPRKRKRRKRRRQS